jgi:hypothetical protein
VPWPQYEPARDGPVFDWIARMVTRLRLERLQARTAVQETRAATWRLMAHMFAEREEKALQRAVAPETRAFRKARKVLRKRRGIA